MAEKILYIALDHNDQASNLTLAQQLAPEQGSFGFKINQDHYSLWKGYVDEIATLKKPFFVDTKINNGSRTMINIIKDIASKGADLTNVWAAAERLIVPIAETLENKRTRLLGVTITTHFTEEYCQRIYKRSLPETVRMWSEIALENGCHGIIIPGTTLDVVKDLKCLKLVPAVRPEWYEDRKSNDQEQTITPTEAIKGGADYLVCGGPIYKHPKPNEALQMILEEIQSARS